VVLSWSRERDGQPALPSPFVERVTLGLTLDPPPAALPRPLRRRMAPDLAAVRAAQAAFAAEPADIPAHAAPLPVRTASHSALAKYRDCPYRFLLERGLGLAEPEEVVESFRRLDHGNAVHACLQQLLEPGGRGAALLANGDRAGALAVLRAAAADEFGRAAASLPQRRLWEEAFLAAAPAVVDCEIDRARAWVPRALEREFRLPLPELHAWLAAAAGEEPPPALPDRAAALALTGKIDRVDVARGDASRASVLDFKTGSRVPTKSSVASGDEPQLVLYAVAVECGRVEGLDIGARVASAGYYRIAPGAVGPDPELAFDDPRLGRAPLHAGARRLLAEALAASEPAGPYPLVPRHRDGEAQGDPPCLLCPHRGVCRIDERDLPWNLRARLAGGRRRR